MRPRIVVLQEVGYRGGSGTMLANMLRVLVAHGFDVTVVCPPGDMTSEFERLGAAVVEAPRPLPQVPHYTGGEYWAVDPRFLRTLTTLGRHYPFWRSWFRDSGADVVQLNAMTLAPLVDAARAGGAAVLGVVQETAVRGWFGLRTALFFRLLSRMDGVMFISDFDRRRAGCRAPVVETIPNWVDLADFDRRADPIRARESLGLPRDARVVLMMGGVSRLKGTDTLIEAAGRLSDLDNVLICVAGYSRPPAPRATALRAILRTLRPRGADLERRIAQTISKHGLQQRVRFLGMRADVAPLYAAADVVVFPASRPHQARPVLEAGSMAKPVIVSDFPQVAEFVTDGHNGLLFRPDDPKSLAAALRGLVTNDERARLLGENNYRMAVKRHDGAVNGQRYAELVTRLATARVAGH